MQGYIFVFFSNKEIKQQDKLKIVKNIYLQVKLGNKYTETQILVPKDQVVNFLCNS